MLLATWAGRSEFQYEGSVAEGTRISWKDSSTASGWSRPSLVKAEEYGAMLSNFHGREVLLGHWPNPPRGSVEEWLTKQYDQWGLTSYIGAILIREGYAERGAGRGRIKFIRSDPPATGRGREISPAAHPERFPLPALQAKSSVPDVSLRLSESRAGGSARSSQQHHTDGEVGLLVDALRRAFGDTPPERTFGDWGTSALNVLDCVLSLNRRYYEFCEPRLDRFAAAHPEVEQLAQLVRLIESYPTPLDFSIAELDYRDAGRATTLVGVCRYMDRIQSAFPGETELSRLKQWAVSVTPEDYEALGVPGFGLAGFQYLRMLFGAETAKPDVHVRRFVAEAVGHSVDDACSLTLLEKAARLLGWNLLALDNEIWEFRAQSGKLM